MAFFHFDRKLFEAVLLRRMSPDKIALNHSPYDKGASMIG